MARKSLGKVAVKSKGEEAGGSGKALPTTVQGDTGKRRQGEKRLRLHGVLRKSRPGGQGVLTPKPLSRKVLQQTEMGLNPYLRHAQSLLGAAWARECSDKFRGDIWDHLRPGLLQQLVRAAWLSWAHQLSLGRRVRGWGGGCDRERNKKALCVCNILFLKLGGGDVDFAMSLSLFEWREKKHGKNTS